MKHLKTLNQVAFGFVIPFVLSATAHGDGFTATGGMAYGRYNHTATRLLDGRAPKRRPPPATSSSPTIER